MSAIAAGMILLESAAVVASAETNAVAAYRVFQNMPLNRITPESWQKNFLLKQREGLTGHLDTTCEPFNHGGWIVGLNSRSRRKTIPKPLAG